MAIRDIYRRQGRGFSELSPGCMNELRREIVYSNCVNDNKPQRERQEGIRVTVRKIYQKGGIETVKKLIDEYNEKAGKELYPFERVKEWIEEDISKGHIQRYNSENTNKGRDDDDDSR